MLLPARFFNEYKCNIVPERTDIRWDAYLAGGVVEINDAKVDGGWGFLLSLRGIPNPLPISCWANILVVREIESKINVCPNMEGGEGFPTGQPTPAVE